MPKKLNLHAFRRKYSNMPIDDEELAQLIITNMVDTEPVVATAVAYLKAVEAFEAGLQEAKIERG